MTGKQTGQVYSMFLEYGDSEILRVLLDRSLPYVYVYCHAPAEKAMWWTANLPINTRGSSHQLNVWGLRYDFKMKTEEFLEIIDEFNEFGMDLYQAKSEISDNFFMQGIESLPESRRVGVLLENGIVAGYHVPHHNEEALFWHYDQACIDRLAQDERLKGNIKARNVLEYR